MKAYALRLPDHILKQARVAAAEDNVSVNQILVTFIAEGLGNRSGMNLMRDRASRADMNAVPEILEKIPDVSPEAGDEIYRDEPSSA